MVKSLSSAGKEALAKAITQAEQKTSAELVAVIAAASDHYSSFVLLYSLMAGTLATIGIWLYQATISFPMLLATQFGIMVLLSLIHPFRHLCIRFIPKTIRHHRATHRAYEEYLRISHHVSAATPIVLFYVSLAEHYVHILPSRLVREKIPGAAWENIVREFTSSLPHQGLQDTSIEATRHITDLLAPHFPTLGQQHLRHPVIEADKG